jgi:hypothetical protein
MGPFLGIAAAAILGAKPADQLLLSQAMHIRQASATVRVHCSRQTAGLSVFSSLLLHVE